MSSVEALIAAVLAGTLITADAAAEPQSAASRSNTQDPLEGYTFQAGIRCPVCETSIEHPQGRSGLHWHDHWRHVGIPEYITTGASFGVGLAFAFVVPPAKSANWTGPILFDQAARDAFELKSSSGRSTAATFSDALVYASIAQATVVDTAIVAWALKASPEVAWQMAVIDAQSYGLTLAVNAVVKRFTARERPYGPTCDTQAASATCKTDRYVSFYSSHTANAATSAGLVCAHHAQLHLYGGAAGDTAACIASIAMMGATGVLRIASDNHWASDVIVGGLMGFASGYLLPTLVYYRAFRLTPEQPGPAKPTVAFVPLIGQDSAQLGAMGRF